MAMAYRTSYRWWVLAIRVSRKKTMVTRKIEKWMATFCLVDLFSTVHKWNCSTSTLQLGVPFISVLRTLQNANSHFVLTHQQLPLPYTRKKDNKCTISNRHWSSSFIHWMMLCHNACCHSTKYYFPLETIFTICGKCRFGLFFPC